MKRLSIALAALGAASCASGPQPAAQSPSPVPAPANAAPAAPQPRPVDVASADAVIAALYDVISGDAGVVRDWDRFRSLFHPSARLIPTGRNREGAVVTRSMTPEDYIRTSGPFLISRGFHERELARRTESFGPLLHAFSSYESKHKLSDPQPFARGVNSIQLVNDGRRWWVLTVAWTGETPETPLPAAYLPR